MNRLTQLAERITNERAFEIGIVAVIFINAVLLGICTSHTLERQYGTWIHLVYEIALGIFVLERLLNPDEFSPQQIGEQSSRRAQEKFGRLVTATNLTSFGSEASDNSRIGSAVRWSDCGKALRQWHAVLAQPVGVCATTAGEFPQAAMPVYWCCIATSLRFRFCAGSRCKTDCL